jgi:hypothetical protein
LNEQISKAIQDVALPTDSYQAMLALLAEDEINSSQMLQKKIVLEEQKRKIESNRNIWFEPMREFFKAAHQAGQMARTENLAAKRDFFRGVGSNIRLSDRTLSFSYVFPWPLLKNSRPNKQANDVQRTSANCALVSKSGEAASTTWCSVYDKVRTWFQSHKDEPSINTNRAGLSI